MKISIKPIAAAAVAVIAVAAPSQAGTFVANGWQITTADNITLTVDSGSSPSTLFLTKDVTFSTDMGALITFNQVDTNASPQIIFNDENVTNDTGTDWSGFAFVLSNPFGPAAGATFASPGQVFNPSTPFKTTTFTSDIVTLSNGVLPSNTTFEWGSTTPGNGLAISAVQGVSMPTNFTFKEIPLEGPTVPLPEACWTALTGLGGLWLIASVRGKRTKSL